MPRATEATADPVLEIEGLRVDFRVGGRMVHAVRDASIMIELGGAVGLVGESGSGKSSLARSLLGLLPSAAATVRARRFRVRGRAVDPAVSAELCRLRGRPIAMVFQDPLSYLNPLMRVGAQIAESVALHEHGTSPWPRVHELIDLVRLPARAAQAYPHELSGGMRQRVMLAIALGCGPDLLIADEPTTALDMTTQAEILALLRDIRAELGMALLLITHDLGAVAEVCDRVYVMYGGHTVESGDRDRVFSRPLHPYTLGLLRAAGALQDRDGRFVTLPGDPLHTTEALAGCPFSARCPQVMPRCRIEMPLVLRARADRDQAARCWLLRAEMADV